MAGSASNWFRPTSGPMAGQAVYISKASRTSPQTGHVYSRTMIMNGLNANLSTFTGMAAKSQRPAGAAKSGPPPATPSGPPATAPSVTPNYSGPGGSVHAVNGQYALYDSQGNLVKAYKTAGSAKLALSKRNSQHKPGPSPTTATAGPALVRTSAGTVHLASNGEHGVYDSQGNLVKAYKTLNGATNALNRLKPAAGASQSSQASQGPQSVTQSATGAGAPGPGKSSPTWYPKGSNVPEFHVPAYSSTRQRDQSIASQQRQASGASLAAGQKKAIANYQDGLGWDLKTLPPSMAGTGQGVYQAVNRRLRGQREPDATWNSPAGRKEVDRIIKGLDGAMKKSTVPEDVIAFRGIRSSGDRNGVFAQGYREFKANVYDQWQVGQTYRPGSGMTDKSYTSTTIDRGTAETIFTRGPNPGIVIEYRIPKGTRGIAMNATNPNSRFSNTAEILLDKDLGYTVVGKYTDPNTGNLHAVLEIIP